MIHGFSNLNYQELSFLRENHYVYQLLCNPILVDNLDLKQQLRLMLDEPTVIPPFFSRLKRLLPLLDSQSILSLVELFGPQHNSKKSSTFLRSSLNIKREDLQKHHFLPTPQDYLEFYLQSLIYLIASHESEKQAVENSEPKPCKDESSDEEELVTGMISSSPTEIEDPQSTLKAALTEHFGKYNSTFIISRCQDLRNWDAAALIFELLYEWPEAMECKLLALNLATSQNPDVSKTIQVVLLLFASFLKNCSHKERDRLLLQVMSSFLQN